MELRSQDNLVLVPDSQAIAATEKFSSSKNSLDVQETF
jgi:hypothetical protein